MFKNMRKLERQLTERDMEEILESGEYGILSTEGENNYPYSVPLNYVYLDKYIYFHCSFEGNKIENINYNNRVCFCVVGNTEIIPEKFTTKYKSAVVFGRASKVSSQEEKRRALIAIIDKYSPDFKKEGMLYIDRGISRTNIMKISVEHATAKGRLK